MSKELDWNAIANVAFDDKRRKATNSPTMRESFQKAYANLENVQAHQNKKNELLPLLKSRLLSALTSKAPIRVLSRISNPTETLGGLVKSEEDDGFYSNGRKAMDGSQTASASFQEAMEVIPAGIDLVFKSLDKTLDQFIFSGSNGEEYAIYTKDAIIFKGSTMENPGLYGLLFHTSLAKDLE